MDDRAALTETMERGAPDRAALQAFVALCGGKTWRRRIAHIAQEVAGSTRAARSVRQHHAIELAITRLLSGGPARDATIDRVVAQLAADWVRVADTLGEAGQARLRARLQDGLSGRHSLVPLFHLIRAAGLQRARGFAVAHAGLEDGAPFDLLIRRDGMDAELACETMSAEDGRDLHRAAWFHLVDGIDPDLQSWLSDHPGRYLLKLTLPQGLRDPAADGQDGGLAPLADLQRRIRDMLAGRGRSDQDETAVLRLDPLLVAGAQAGELGLLDALRSQFGPQAQLAVTRGGAGMLVMAARAGRQDDVGAALRRRLHLAAPRRFTGGRPGILAMFLDHADPAEWRALRDGLLLEGQTRQFLTTPAAAGLVAVTAASRAELFGIADAADEGELRFRNQAHPAARSQSLAPSVRPAF